MALGWKCKCDLLDSPLSSISTSCMVGVEVKFPQMSLSIISVYLPGCTGCIDDFKESLNHLEAAISLLPPPDYCFG